MEMRTGYALNGPRVSGPVRVGDPLTLIIDMLAKVSNNNYPLKNSTFILGKLRQQVSDSRSDRGTDEAVQLIQLL